MKIWLGAYVIIAVFAVVLISAWNGDPTIFSRRGTFTLRLGRWKYVHHVDGPPELFDLEEDPDELLDLALDPGHDSVRRSCEAELSRLVDAQAVDARARAHQRRRLDAGGGIEHVRSGGPKIIYTPPPAEFQRAAGT